AAGRKRRGSHSPLPPHTRSTRASPAWGGSCAKRLPLQPDRRAVTAHLDEISTVAGAGELGILPVRVRFGIESFGVNAYTALADGGRVIEEHDELGAGAGRHEELYFVARGRAVFTLSGEEVDAPAGTLVYVPDPAVRRGAVATETETVVLVVGGVPGRP